MSAFGALVRGADELARAVGSVPEGKGLVTTHAISYEKLNRANEKWGGRLPNPSIGIHKESLPNTNFGDILLVMKPKMLDEPAARVYATDVHSATVPGTAASPDEALEIMNRAPDKLSETALKGLSTISKAVAYAAERLPGAEGVASARSKFADVDSDAVFKKDNQQFAWLGDRIDLDRGRSLVQDALGKTLAGEKADLSAFDEVALPKFLELAEQVGARSSPYGEVRTGRIVQIGKGGDAEVAIVPAPYPGEENLWQLARNGLKARGVEVIDVKARFATPEYTTAWAAVAKKLRERGLVLGTGGAAVTALALADVSTNEAMAGDLPEQGLQEALQAEEAQRVAMVPAERQNAASVQPASEDVPLTGRTWKVRTRSRDAAGEEVYRKAFGERKVSKWRSAGGFTVQSTQPETQEVADVTPSGFQQLVVDEGERLKAYKDTKGIDTIGVGFNLEEDANVELFEQIAGFPVAEARAGREISREVSRKLLAATVTRAEADARSLVPNLDKMPPRPRDAVVNFVFNTGFKTASQFKNTLAAINRGDGKAAAEGIRNSLYYKQVGARGERVAKALETLNGQ